MGKLKLKKEWERLARTDYTFYIEYVHKGVYKHARHTEYLCGILEQVERGEIKRLIVQEPPRHSKSMTITETFPSYFIGKNPNRRVIQVSYSDSLARKFGRHNRTKISEFGEDVFGVKVSTNTFSANNWNIQDHRGGMISAGIGGPITGEGADLLIIDDPIKNRKEANSKTYRDMIWDEWRNTLLTRLHPGARVIIVMTRWHEDDLVGRLLNPEYDGDPDEWTVVNLPAEAEENDPLGREVGEPLWEERGYGYEWIENKKKELGTMTWLALYQGRPTSPEGQIFRREWWQFYDRLPNDLEVLVQSWDCAFKDLDSSDPISGQVWGRKSADYYLIDRINGKMDIINTMKAIVSMSQKYPKARAKYIEDKANGPAVIQMLRRKISGLIAVNPEGGKLVRAQAVAPLMEAGNVYLPSPAIAPWVNDFLEEVSAFPNGKHDDDVDAMTQALNQMSSKQELKATNSLY